MKIGNQTTSEFESNASITSENSTEFQIGDPSIVIEILRKRLYSNPIQTSTQEYLCNGRDATREAGNETTPLIVTLPGYDGNSELRIRDFGKGLPPAKMKNVFVYYGVSTKRGTDKYTGGFGIGAKSAWAYTDSFMVLTYVDGIAYNYAAFINEKSVGELTLMSQSETDQANGTEIRIPVNPTDKYAFIQAVFRSTMFWEVKPTILGQGYPSLSMKPLFEDHNIAMYEPQELGKLFSPQDSYNLGVVLSIDGIPYPLERNFEAIPQVAQFKKYLKNGRVTVIKANTGDIEVSASREKVADSEFSKKKIGALFQKELDKCKLYVEEKNAECKSLKELVVVSNQINKLFDVNTTYKFKASESNTYEVDSSGCLKTALFSAAHIDNWSYTSTNRRKNVLTGEACQNAYLYGNYQFVLNDTSDGPNVMREKIKILLEKGARNIYLIREKLFGNESEFTGKDIAQFVTEMGGCTLSSVIRPKKEKVVRSVIAPEDMEVEEPVASVYYFKRARAYGNTKPGYLDELNLTELPADKKIVYVVREKQNVYTSPYSIKAFEELTQYFDHRKDELKVEFCAVTANAVGLIQDHNQFIHLDVFLANLDEKIVARIQQGLVRECNRGTDARLSKLEFIIDKLDDKKFKEKRDFLKQLPAYGLGYNEVFCVFVRKNYSEVLEQEKLADAAFFEYYSKAYPLLDKFYASELKESLVLKNEVIIYMNLKYAKIMSEEGV